MWKRIKNRISITGLVSVLLGAGVWIQQGGLSIPRPTPPFYWFGIALIILGVILSIVGWIKNPQVPKPNLFIRSSGFSRLAKDYTQQFQRFSMLYEVTISNPSSKLRLGIKNIILTWEKPKDDRQINILTPILGDIDIRSDEKQPAIKGDIGNSFNLEPNEVKTGKLLFVVEENKFVAMGQYKTEVFIITDNQDNKYKYPVRGNKI